MNRSISAKNFKLLLIMKQIFSLLLAALVLFQLAATTPVVISSDQSGLTGPGSKDSVSQKSHAVVSDKTQSGPAGVGSED